MLFPLYDGDIVQCTHQLSILFMLTTHLKSISVSKQNAFPPDTTCKQSENIYRKHTEHSNQHTQTTFKVSFIITLKGCTF